MNSETIQKLVFVGTRKFCRDSHRAVDKASKEKNGLYNVNVIKCVQSEWFANYPRVEFMDKGDDGKGVLKFQKHNLTSVDVVEGIDCMVYQSEFVNRNREAIDVLHKEVLNSSELMLSQLTDKVKETSKTFLQLITKAFVMSSSMKSYSESLTLQDIKTRIITGSNLELVTQLPDVNERIYALIDNAYVLNEKCDFDTFIGNGNTQKIKLTFNAVNEFLRTKTQIDLQNASEGICNIIDEFKTDNPQNQPSFYT